MRTLVLHFILVSAVAVAQDDAMLAGITALQMKDHPAAEAAFTRAVGNSPDDVRTWYYRGVNRLSVGDYPGALADLDRVIALAPDDAYGLLKRSEAHARLGGTAAARRDLAALLQNQPTGPAAEQALHALGGYSLAEGDVRGAYRHFDQLVGIAPYNAQALADRGAALAAMGRDVEALEDLELAVDRDPSLAIAHAQMAVVLLNMGRKQEACYALHSAHALGERSVEQMLLVHCDR